jgi:hypothetical protein
MGRERLYHIIKAVQVFALGCLIEIKRKRIGLKIVKQKNLSSESILKANISLSKLGNRWMELKAANENDNKKDAGNLHFL